MRYITEYDRRAAVESELPAVICVITGLCLYQKVMHRLFSLPVSLSLIPSRGACLSHDISSASLPYFCHKPMCLFFGSFILAVLLALFCSVAMLDHEALFLDKLSIVCFLLLTLYHLATHLATAMGLADRRSLKDLTTETAAKVKWLLA